MVRIKHYNYSGYAGAKQEIKTNMKKEDEEHLKQNLMNKQQKWCSFRIGKKFAFENETRTAFYFEEIEESDTHQRVIHHDWKPSQTFLDAVKKHGWNDLPKYSETYRQRKDIEEITFHRKKDKISISIEFDIS